MPLDFRPIAISIAVIFFFGFSLIGVANGLESFTCCKRAMIGAIAAYIAAVIMVRAVNSIIMNAIINKQLDIQKEENNNSDNTN